VERGFAAVGRRYENSVGKASPRVVVFTQNDPALLKKAARERAIHKVETIDVFALAPAFLDSLDAATDRSSKWLLSHSEDISYVTIGDKSLSAPITRQTLSPDEG
jgi:hypothetical protein